jgi:hypothetical protein
VNLCQHLLSHPLPEAQKLGTILGEELALAAPRLLKHATLKDSIKNGIKLELDNWQRLACESQAGIHHENSSGHPPTAFLETFAPRERIEADVDLSHHDNRYAWIGEGLKRTGVRFGWEAVTLAEIRDLNRHRTGNKHCPLIPRGFYAALDELPAGQPEIAEVLHRTVAVGHDSTVRAFELLQQGDASFVYWTLLGTQYYFEHITTADKFLYEAELRTGTGAHYRYARHLHDALQLWFEKYPETRGMVLEGMAEPE